jgi:copper chaperone
MTSTTTEHITLLSPDISCGHCVGTVQSAVGQIDGVSDVQASAETKFVEVTFDPARTSVEQITTTLAQSGYPAQQ